MSSWLFSVTFFFFFNGSRQEYFNDESYPSPTCCPFWERNPCASYYFFFLLYHSLKLLWNICIRLKEFGLSVPKRFWAWCLILVLLSSWVPQRLLKEIRTFSWVNFLVFLPKMVAELYFLISRFYLLSCLLPLQQNLIFTLLCQEGVYFCIRTFKHFRLFMCASEGFSSSAISTQTVRVDWRLCQNLLLDCWDESPAVTTEANFPEHMTLMTLLWTDELFEKMLSGLPSLPSPCAVASLRPVCC